jgi:hypothetical protein
VGVMDAVMRGRRAAERNMTDRCVIRRPTGETTTDPVTYEVTPVYEVVYEGRCKYQTYQAYESSRESAGATVTTQRSTLHLPVGALRTLPGDVVTCVASVDPLMVGSSARIAQEAPSKSHATAYRVFIDENIGEEVPPWPTP